ncbi:DUF2778 domain-containing protein [Undibacter mobilis]|uniref:DUF2778 domain-containing protein n=1 Tax=Undibacter mobilis TaxID=2292256 RepID=A0A371B0W1_9BRAD|nr:tlde1 domain-containing protein [Undibacter mobilis]RDV01180.1 DUF2778 domain-containing protein [Undibacter mobilis]
MTYTAAVTISASWGDHRRVSSAIAGRALRIVRNSFLLGIGAVGFVGVSALAVTFTAAWMVGGTMQPHTHLPSGPGSLVLTPYDQTAKAAVRGQGGAQWADAFIDRSKSILPAEQTRAVIAQPNPAPTTPAARTPAVPMPRPLPARLAQLRAEIEAPKPVVTAEAPVAAPIVALPVPKPEGASKLEAMAKIDPKPEAREEAKAPPKPAPVASIPPASLPDSVSRTAVYDITGSVVHMPDGTKLEAHSGLGERMDDPRHIKVRMRGPTPPNVYVLTEREKLFHGVRAIRLNPVYDDKMFGRDGMLAHTYMLGPNGQSNGCVSFKDYKKFLTAFLDGKVDKLVVVTDLKSQTWKSAAMQADGIPASVRRFAGGYSRPTVMPRGGDDAEPRYTAALGFAPERGAGDW